MNLETKIIWRQVRNGPNLDQIIIFGYNNNQFMLDIIVVYTKTDKSNDSNSRTAELGHFGPILSKFRKSGLIT